ncbi:MULTISPECIES: metallophosphoesterase family protein [Cyanophyceae]|uniref:metallophosphoesterase family protein n=1 Tax=Cyanophyceae TaxID=3028117 RepID=UPI0016838741|nr:metallophosphoesterase [Trichocoleus sp. FACHB-832]MBD1907703.1 metallophosphoesterase [Trichocoleus sp. FACHB-832]
MSLNFRFAVVSDLHIALPHTISDHPSRFHLVEVSIPALEIVLKNLEKLDLDFLLLPGDLTQDGEPDNHAWLAKRLLKLPFPVFVVPGNHDVLSLVSTGQNIGLKDFPYYYQQFGYKNPEQLYYTCEILPGVRLIGLNSNQFDDQGKQIGCLDEQQLAWLRQVLADIDDNELVLVMVHHNVVEHLPEQSQHQLGRRYMLKNAPLLLEILRDSGVNLVFTGHLHVQDIACDRNVFDITTGSLVSYPHPYRILDFRTDKEGRKSLQIDSPRVESVPNYPMLSQKSREWMGDRSVPFMLKLLTDAPLNLPIAEAEKLVPNLRYFWADIANGDALFDFSEFPPAVKRYFESFGAIATDGTPKLIDNSTILFI